MSFLVIDFHSHVLPGIDDGSKNVEMSLAMLAQLGQQGVDIVLATPHFYADQVSLAGFLKRREHAVQRLLAEWKDGLPGLVCGAEAAYFPGIGSTEEIRQVCLEGTNLLLLEMPFAPWGAQEVRDVEALLNQGLCVILAHIERFYAFQTSFEYMERILSLPVYVQVNAESFLEKKVLKHALNLFESGTAQLLGSDCHNLESRPPNLGPARAILAGRLGETVLQQMDQLGQQLLGL